MWYKGIIILLLLPLAVLADSYKFGPTIHHDGFMHSGAPTNNFSGPPFSEMWIYNTSGTTYLNGFSGLDATWADSIGAGNVIDSMVCTLTIDNALNNADVDVYYIWKSALSEATVTWADWQSTDNEWGTAGCNNVYDDATWSSHNSTDGGGYDRTETALTSFSVSDAQTGEFTWRITDGDMLTAIYDAGEQLIFCFIAETNDSLKVEGSEDATNFPVYVIYYSSAVTRIDGRLHSPAGNTRLHGGRLHAP